MEGSGSTGDGILGGWGRNGSGDDEERSGSKCDPWGVKDLRDMDDSHSMLKAGKSVKLSPALAMVLTTDSSRTPPANTSMSSECSSGPWSVLAPVGCTLPLMDTTAAPAPLRRKRGTSVMAGPGATLPSLPPPRSVYLPGVSPCLPPSSPVSLWSFLTLPCARDFGNLLWA